MSNNLLFFIHVGIITLFLYSSLRLGKEALMAFVAGSWIAANFYVIKEIQLFGFEVTASDAYTIGAMLGLFLIQEYWGRKEAKATITLSFFLLAFTALASYLHLQYVPSSHDTSHDAFERVLTGAPRLACASLITFFIVQYAELALFTLFQKNSHLSLPLRAFCIGSITQCLDTLLFSLLGLSGIVHSLVDVFVVSYSVKLIVLVISTPTVAFSHHFLPKNYERHPI